MANKYYLDMLSKINWKIEKNVVENAITFIFNNFKLKIKDNDVFINERKIDNFDLKISSKFFLKKYEIDGIELKIDLKEIEVINEIIQKYNKLKNNYHQVSGEFVRENKKYGFKYTNYNKNVNKWVKNINNIKILKIDDVVIKNEIENKNQNEDTLYEIGGYTFINMPNLEFPINVEYKDITEEMVLGHSEINASNLEENGIWGYHGNRVFEVKFDNLLNVIKDPTLDINYKLILENANNVNINEELIVDQSMFKTNLNEKNSSESNLIVKFELDTDYLSKKYLNEENESIMLFLRLNLDIDDNEGSLSIEFEDNQEEYRNLKYEAFQFSIPLIVKILNPINKKYLKNYKVSVDFGTSSTCIAYNAGSERKLVSLEKGYGIDSFENPTNLLFKDWDIFYKEWSKRNETIPNILRSKEYENYYNLSAFTQGLDVKNKLKNEITRSESFAIIDKIKTIPFELKKMNNDLYITPSSSGNSEIKRVKLVTAEKEQDIENFDPIEFYGFLIGRSLSTPLNKYMLTKFYFTMPVKYDAEIRKSIKLSLTRGIKLSYPSVVRDKIEINDGYEEPIAFIGAVLNESNSLKNLHERKNIAVFDFGGGTLDFSFAICREPENIKESQSYEKVIEIIKTAGDPTGGAEHLMKRVAFRIYKKEMVQMQEHSIPFICPFNEEMIPFFPSFQNDRTIDAQYNIRKIIERIVRDIFEREDEYFDLEREIELLDNTGKIKRLYLENITIEEIREDIVELLNELVETFEEGIDEVFEDKKNVIIFRAGNASRSKLLEQILFDKFRDYKIEFIDKKGQYEVNPKKSVVLGELILRMSNDVLVKLPKEDSIGFDLKISVYKNNEYIEKLNKYSNKDEWYLFSRVNIDNRYVMLFYTSSLTNSTYDFYQLEFDQNIDLENGNYLWIRPSNQFEIEWTLTSGSEPDENNVINKLELKGEYHGK